MPCLFWSILIPDLVPCLGYFLGVSRLVSAPDGSEIGAVGVPVPFSDISLGLPFLRPFHEEGFLQ